MPFIGPDGHRHWVAAIHVSHLQPVLPTVYDESLSYYEVLCKLQYKINEVIAALDQETDERIEADTHLANLIAELRKYAEEIEIKLTEMIQNEINRAMQNELRIEEKFDLEIKTLTDMVNEFDRTLKDAIEYMKNQLEEFENSLQIEIDRATNAESDLNERITECQEKCAADKRELEDKINNEIVRAGMAEQLLQQNINNLSSGIDGKIDNVYQAIENETTRAQHEENDLKQLVELNNNRAIEAENTLTEMYKSMKSALDTERIERVEGDKKNTDALNSEIERAMQAELELLRKIQEAGGDTAHLLSMIESLQNNVEVFRNTTNSKFERVWNQFAKQKDDIDAVNKRVDDITGGIDLDQLKTDVDNLKEQENDLENRVNNLENSQQEQDVKIKELENLANSNKENLLETMKDIDAEIKPALERDRKDIDELKANDLTHTQQESLLQLQIIELREKNETQDTEIENLKEQIETATTNGVTHAEFNEYKTEVTNNFNTVNETNDKQDQDIANLKSKDAELESSIQSIQEQIEGLTIEEISATDIDGYWAEIWGG